MSPRLAVVLLAALLLLAGAVKAQKDKAQETSVESELESSVVNPNDEEEEELSDASAGADRADADVLEDYTEDTFSVAPALRADQDNVSRRPKKPSNKPPRAKPVGDWYGLRTPKDLLDGLDGDVRKDLTGAGGLCGQQKKVKVLQRDGTVKVVVQDACAVPVAPRPKKVVRVAKPMRPKAIRPKRKVKPIVSEDEEEDDELSRDVGIKKPKQKKRKNKNQKPPTEEEEADSLIPRSQMMELTKAEEKRATDEFQAMKKRAKKRKPSKKLPFPGYIPIGADGERIGRKGFNSVWGSQFKAGPEDIMPLGSSAAKAAKPSKSKRLTLIDPSDLEPLLDGSFLQLETDVVRAFDEASQQMENEDHEETEGESML